jgi:hypothetical protein
MTFFDREKKVFQGVYACDEIENKHIKKYPAAFIVNLDTRKQSGSHWVAIFVTKNKIASYFDSFGLRPNNKHIMKFLRKTCKTFRYNKDQLQSINSTVCGLYCIMFILFKMGKMLPRIKIADFSKYFSKNTFINDLKTASTINKLKYILKS